MGFLSKESEMNMKTYVFTEESIFIPEIVYTHLLENMAIDCPS